VDQHPLGQLQRAAGREIKGARVFKIQMFIIVGSMFAVGAPRALRLAETCGRQTLFNASQRLLLPGEASGVGICSSVTVPGPVRDRDLANPIITSSWRVLHAASLQISCTATSHVGILVGMSLDARCRQWVSMISPRFRSRQRAWLYCSQRQLLIGYNYWGHWASMTLVTLSAATCSSSVASRGAAALPCQGAL